MSAPQVGGAHAAQIPINDLARASEAEIDALASVVTGVIRRGWYIDGPERRAFEDEFAEYLGVASCVGVANGTDALELAMRAVGCEPGDEILLAANAGMYGATAASRAGLRPKFADVEPSSLCLSLQTVVDQLTDATRAVLVTHLYGATADVQPIVAECHRRGVLVIEDCAQAAGAERDGKRVGSFGDAAAFSFYPTKNLAAMGDAGAVATSDESISERLGSLRQYGWETKYRVTTKGGRNSRLDEMQAAVLRRRLPGLDEANMRRRRVAASYEDTLSPSLGRLVRSAPGTYVAHLAVLLTPNGRREDIAEVLHRHRVQTDVHYPIPDHHQPVWDGAYEATRLPVTEAAATRVLTLPCFPQLTDSEVERVCAALAAAASG